MNIPHPTHTEPDDLRASDVRPLRPVVKNTAATRRQPSAILHRALQHHGAFESWIARSLRRVSGRLLRGSLALVFVWFGALKLAGVTPVGDLVAASVPWLDRSWFVPVLGLVEVLLGLALLLGRFLTTISLVLVGHLAATFLVLVMQPDLSFQDGNPMLLTTVGEFVVKNLVLASAAVAVAAWSRPVGTAPRQGSVA